MSQNYELARLGDLCDSISGLWTGKKPPFEKATVIRNTNFTKDCKLDLSNVAILDVETKQLQTRTLVPGDLIVEKSGGGPKQAVGRVVYFKETTGNYSLSNFTSALRIKNSTLVLPKYLQHFLYFQYVSGVTELMQSNSTGIRNLNIHQFLDIKVPLPNLSKQHLIVEKLDLAFSEIDLMEKNLELSDQKATQLLGSILAASFTSFEIGSENNALELQDTDMKIVKLSEACSFSRGLTYGKGDEVDFSSNVVLRANNIDLASNSLNLADLRYIKDSITIKDEKIAKKDSIIICTASGSKSHVGKVALIDKDYGYAYGGFMGQLTPSENCLPKYLYFILISRMFKDYLMTLNDGTNINNLKFADIEGYEFPLPSLERQFRIIQKLDLAFSEVEKVRNQIAVKKDLAGMLRQSLLSESFSPNLEKGSA